MSFFLVNLAYAGEFVLVVVVIVGSDSCICARRIRTICLHFEHLTYSIRWMRDDRDTHPSTEYRITSKGETRTDVVNNAIRACLVQNINDSAGIVRGQLIAFWVIIQMSDLFAYLKTIEEIPFVRDKKWRSRSKKPVPRERTVFVKKIPLPFRSARWYHHYHAWYYRKKLYSISLGLDRLSANEFHPSSYLSVKWQCSK